MHSKPGRRRRQRGQCAEEIFLSIFASAVSARDNDGDDDGNNASWRRPTMDVGTSSYPGRLALFTDNPVGQLRLRREDKLIRAGDALMSGGGTRGQGGLGLVSIVDGLAAELYRSTRRSTLPQNRLNLTSSEYKCTLIVCQRDSSTNFRCNSSCVVYTLSAVRPPPHCLHLQPAAMARRHLVNVVRDVLPAYTAAIFRLSSPVSVYSVVASFYLSVFISIPFQ